MKRRKAKVKRRAKREVRLVPLPPKAQSEYQRQWEGFTNVMHEIAALQAQLAGVKLDIEGLQNKVLGVNAVMMAQWSTTLATFNRRLDEWAHRK